jgi:hypothetical protein
MNKKIAGSAKASGDPLDFLRSQRGGMTILRPSMTVSFVILLACLMDALGILYLALMPERVSPATTVWMRAAP